VNFKSRDFIARDRQHWAPLPKSRPARDVLRTQAGDAVAAFLAAGGAVPHVPPKARHVVSEQQRKIAGLDYGRALTLALKGEL
jgi:hypothetical protein